ncbi:MAG: hypothetical protein PHU36_09835 [Syntrophomonadaceae bacterium]|nr:hypothetical protein [Syntrophomonadaceae bacterium]
MKIKSIKMVIVFVLLAIIFFNLYGYTQFARSRVDGENYPVSFNVLKNYDGQVKIELSDLLGKGKYLNKKLYYKIDDSAGDKNYIDSATMLIEHSFKKSGTYTFKIYQKGLLDKLLWRQDVFVIRQTDYTHKKTSSEEKRRELAAEFSPVLSYFHDPGNNMERYYPLSLDWLFQNDQSLFLHDFKSISGKRYIVDNLRYLGNFLRYNGGSAGGRALIDFPPGKYQLVDLTGSPDLATVYYSVFEDADRVYLNYHFIYAFDFKINEKNTQQPAIASHNFDRESMTVVFEKKGETLEPAFLAMGQHMKGQSMSLYDEHDQQVQHWYGDGVKVRWAEINKYGAHPVAAIARGSHAVYPVAGRYNVYQPYLGAFGNHREYAGLVANIDYSARGLDSLLLPEQLQAEVYEHKNYYKLESLDLDNADSSNVVSYSGYWVDGLSNFKFPPFTDRERDISAWVDSLWWFDMSNVPEKWRAINEQIMRYIEYKPNSNKF